VGLPSKVRGSVASWRLGPIKKNPIQTNQIKIGLYLFLFVFALFWQIRQYSWRYKNNAAAPLFHRLDQRSLADSLALW